MIIEYTDMYDAPYIGANVVGQIRGNVDVVGNMADKNNLFLKLYTNTGEDLWVKWDNSYTINSEKSNQTIKNKIEEHECNCDFLCSECA